MHRREGPWQAEVGHEVSAQTRFWGEREVLRRVVTQARVVRKSPEALLAAVLVRAACLLGPHVRLQSPDGTARGSLNMFAALVGESAKGKSMLV